MYVSKFAMGINDNIILRSEASEAQQPWRKDTKHEGNLEHSEEWSGYHLRIENVVTLLQFALLCGYET